MVIEEKNQPTSLTMCREVIIGLRLNQLWLGRVSILAGGERDIYMTMESRIILQNCISILLLLW